jgi:acyl-CoA reductase-like NAD-dependent aldehyde dehydrogenase
MIPGSIANWLDGGERPALGGQWMDKLSPATGKLLARAARSGAEDVQAAVASARRAQPAWAALTPVARGELLLAICQAMRASRQDLAEIVALETGKSRKAALGETDGAIALGQFYAGEGQRFYGRTTTSGTPHRQASVVREPIGVAGLIIAANTPIANVAWKVFPALICGNSAILKSAEDTPATAWMFARLTAQAGLPPGVLSVLQGLGPEVGAPLVAHPEVDVVSFTGSTAVGREIAAVAGRRLARISLELGGKNPLVVCDDADLDNAVKWTLLSAFSNAGQRCAAASRIIVFESVYQAFKAKLLDRTLQQKVGPEDGDDFGPVINERQLGNMLRHVEQAVKRGAKLLAGGQRLTDPAHRDGFYLAPTLVEDVPPADDLSRCELFGPVANLYRVADFEQALALANDSPYGLTACIHTRNVNRAMLFTRRVQAGVVFVNAGTFGSEPHMPFGGVKQSGNGSREPGTEALDVYSNVKQVCWAADPGDV